MRLSKFTPAQPSSTLPLRLLVIACFLFFFGMATDAALQKSPTADEPVHVARGIAIWQAADLRLQQEHTPLSHILSGSLAATEAKLPAVTTLDGWAERDRLRVARDLVWQQGVNVERLFFLARLPIIFVGLALGAVLICWSGLMAGSARRRAQAICAILFAFSPNLIANAAVATTDFVATAAYTCAIFAFCLYAREPHTRGRWLLAGVALGLGLAAKMTGLLLLPLTLALAWLWGLRGSWWPQWLRWGGLLPLAGVTLWATYRFELGPAVLPPLGLTLPLPAPTYLSSFFNVTGHIGGGHRAFFLGEFSSEGWWSYFAVAFLIKTPLVTLALLAVAVWHTARSRAWGETAVLWLPALLLFAVATYTRLNIGYRHILPVLPFLLVWIGAAVGRAVAGRRLAHGVLVAALLWYGLAAIRQHPHHLAYFNELVGGSANGRFYLGDSNLDWGQDFTTLSRYVNKVRPPNLRFAPFGFADPRYYGLDRGLLLTAEGLGTADFAAANPAPALYAISVNALQGNLAQPDLFDWFRRRPPLDERLVGYSILLYEVTAAADGKWIAHCADPAPQLTAEAAEQLIGLAGLRHVRFNCQESWAVPAGGAGWYILPRQQEAWWISDWVANGLTLVYSHEATVFAPAYEVYYWDGSANLAAALPPAPAELPDGSAVALPAAVGDVAALEGVTQQGERWFTRWRVTKATAAPLSVLAHLYTPSLATPLVADGLGFGSDQWQPGDMFIQVHVFEEGATADYLETGLYDFTTGERLPLADSGATSLRLRP